MFSKSSVAFPYALGASIHADWLATAVAFGSGSVSCRAKYPAGSCSAIKSLDCPSKPNPISCSLLLRFCLLVLLVVNPSCPIIHYLIILTSIKVIIKH